MTTTSSFISIGAVCKVSTVGSLRISAMFMSVSLVMTIDSLSIAAGAPRKWKVLPSRGCREGRLGGIPERRFEDADVLRNGATAYADARDQLAFAGKRRPAAH